MIVLLLLRLVCRILMVPLKLITLKMVELAVVLQAQPMNYQTILLMLIHMRGRLL